MFRIIFSLPLVLAGSVVLLGWLLGDPVLERLGLATVPMNPATAIGIILSSLALSLNPQSKSSFHKMARGVAIIGLIGSLLKLSDLIFGSAWNIDGRLFAEELDRNGKNLMAPNAAFNFLLISSAILLGGVEKWPCIVASQLLAVACSFVAILAVIGYVYRTISFYGVGSFTPMALHTALCFIFLSLGVLALNSRAGIMACINNSRPPGQMARLLLPSAVIIPVGLGALNLAGAKRAFYAPEFGNSLYVAVNVGIFLIIAWISARWLWVGDRLRLQAEAELGLTQEALRQSQKLEAIGQLTGGVAHDFNNLLTVIRSSVELLQRPNLSPEKQEKYIKAIGQTTDRAAKLTSQLLAFSRQQVLNPEPFEVGQSLGNLTDILKSLAGSRISVSLAMPERNCIIFADKSQFDTSIVNLALNARDAMRGEGTIGISCAVITERPPLLNLPDSTAGYVAISLADTGAGIAPENLERIFEPFFTTKEVGAGTGLGLSQVFGFVRQSGGDLRVESTVGTGTTFTLYMPLSLAATGPIIG